MPDRKRKKDSASASAAPFFARYLEGQRAEHEAEGGDARMTLKYPSDRDEIDYR